MAQVAGMPSEAQTSVVLETVVGWAKADAQPGVPITLRSANTPVSCSCSVRGLTMFRKVLIAVVFVAGLGVLGSPGIATAAPYKNCTEARENGDSNIPASSDKYGSHLDRDNDGVGCES